MDIPLEIYFVPPMAIARLGAAETPADSFRWTETPHSSEGPRTRIVPDVSLQVLPDGSVLAMQPVTIQFKDADDAIRPVAPFFELRARVQREADGQVVDEVINLAWLQRFGLSLRDVSFEITAANRKAERRTGAAQCSFVARATLAGDDHVRRRLLAFSPHMHSQQPLVPEDRPIPLGWIQVVRPAARQQLGIDLSVLRVRFTPPAGLVYGPVSATSGPAPEVAPGLYEDTATQFGRIHPLVLPENRILNGETLWSARYHMMDGSFEDPPPQDGYDGGAVGDFSSWGTVDDTSDSLIVATLAVGGNRLRSTARVLTGPPDFAPDRRPVYSIADDIADRELGIAHVPAPNAGPGADDDVDASKAEVLDLFHRAFETLSLFNLDAIRTRALVENGNRFFAHGGTPKADLSPKAMEGSMTASDTPYVDKMPALAPLVPPSRYTHGTPGTPLPFTTAVRQIHGQMLEQSVIFDFFLRRRDHLTDVVRPPYGHLGELAQKPPARPSKKHRDPRVFRDQLHDMRMPPYMRDANLQPLSLSHRQYHELMAVAALDAAALERPIPMAALKRYGNKIFPRNLTARADRAVVGNPVTTRMESGVGNCFPGLEFDLRVLDNRFFPGLVFQYVTTPLYPSATAVPNQQGARVLYADWLLDPLLPEDSDQAWVKELIAQYRGPLAKPRLTSGRWYLDWIEQNGCRVCMTDPSGAYYDGEIVWRLVRCLQPDLEVKIGLVQRVGTDPNPLIALTGRRRPFIDAKGIFDEAYRPGELTNAMCNPWTHDFRDCACHYWASNHPDVVITERPALPGEPAKTAPGFMYADWLRRRGSASAATADTTIAKNRVYEIDHYEINTSWQKLPFVVEGREIGLTYQPATSQPLPVPPYATVSEMIDELQDVLAVMELSLAVEYLYAHFSLKDATDLGASPDYPSLADDLGSVRQSLLRVAVSEMTHLRWVNQILWEIHRGGFGDGRPYLPVVKIGPWLDKKKAVVRHVQLRRLTPDVLDEFLETERPGGPLDAAYSRCIATFEAKAFSLPERALELARRIDAEGIDHFTTFSDIKRRLGAYPAAHGAFPYLRSVKVQTGDKTAKAVAKFKNILKGISQGYADEATSQYPAAQQAIKGARDTMIAFRDEAENLARAGYGIPFV